MWIVFNNQVDQIFRDALGNWERMPDNNMFGSIQSRLPKRKPPFFNFYRLAAAASVLIAVVSYLNFSPFAPVLNSQIGKITSPIKKGINKTVNQLAANFHSDKNQSTILNAVETNNAIASIDLVKNEISIPKKANVELLTPLNHAAIAKQPAVDFALKEKNEPDNNPVLLASIDNQILEQIKWKPLAFENGDEDYNKSKLHKKVITDVFIDQLLKRQLYFIKGFNIGAKAEFNNTWILVNLPQTTFNAPQVNFKIDGGLAYGLTAGYDFNDKIGIQTEWHMVSQMAQRYEVSQAYTIQDRTIKLTYMNFPVLVKLKMSRLTALEKNPIVMNYVMGLQYGIIRTGNVLAQKNSEQDIMKQINSQQMSVVLGINYDMYLSEHVFFTLGGRTTFGKDIRPTLFSDVASHKSRNFTLGVEAGLHYKLFNKDYRPAK